MTPVFVDSTRPVREEPQRGPQFVDRLVRFVETHQSLRTVEYVIERLGFVKRGDHSGPHGRFVTVAPETDENVELVLMAPDGFDDEEAENLSKMIGRDMGLIYEVDDCQRTYDELRNRGVEFRGEPEEMPWGIQTVAVDPDGNEIVLQEPVRAARD